MIASALVTGAGGYVGATLCHHLVAAGVQVVGLDRLSRGRPGSLPLTVPVVAGDVTDPSSVHEALRTLPRVPEVCFHLAGASRIAASVLAPESFHHANAIGTQVVIDACAEAGVECFIYTSTAAVLAPPPDAMTPLDEDAPVGPLSPYGHSKLAAEQTVQVATETGRMTAVIARLFNPTGAAYGCAEAHDPETHLVPLAIQAALGLRDPLLLFGDDHPTFDGYCVRDYVHVRDVCEALLRAANHRLARHRGGDTGWDLFHVGSGRGHSVMEVLVAVEEAIGRKVPYELAERRPGDMASVVGCPVRMSVVLGLRPATDLASMVRDAGVAMGLLPPVGAVLH